MEQTSVTCDACGITIKGGAQALRIESVDLCFECRGVAVRKYLESRGDNPLLAHCTVCSGTGKVRVVDEDQSTASCGEIRTAYKKVPCSACAF